MERIQVNLTLSAGVAQRLYQGEGKDVWIYTPVIWKTIDSCEPKLVGISGERSYRSHDVAQKRANAACKRLIKKMKKEGWL